MMANYNELRIPIDHVGLAEEHGVRKFTISYSITFNSWVITGHPTIHMICIKPPYTKGDIFTTESKGKESRFNGMKVSGVVIKDNMWCFSFNEHKNTVDFNQMVGREFDIHNRLKQTGLI